jgi:hypothetical protein
MPSILNATTSTGFTVTPDNSGSLQLATNNGTTAVTIDTSQNVGIGTTSPTSGSRLDVVSTDSSQSFVNVLKLKTTNTGDVHPAILFENNRNSVSNAFQVSLNSGTTAGSSLLTFIAKDSGGTFNRVVDIENNGDFQFNSGYGSVATAYGCRAWVNFNGTGTVAIRASGNVSSITDNGTGDYTVNFTTAMSDANYTTVAQTSSDSGTALLININSNSANNTAPTTSATRMFTNKRSDGSATDSPYVNVAIVR